MSHKMLRLFIVKVSVLGYFPLYISIYIYLQKHLIISNYDLYRTYQEYSYLKCIKVYRRSLDMIMIIY